MQLLTSLTNLKHFELVPSVSGAVYSACIVMTPRAVLRNMVALFFMGKELIGPSLQFTSIFGSCQININLCTKVLL